MGYNIEGIILGAVPFLLAITFHEYAHGWVADRLGDSTARLSGRLTFNPLKHLDFFGTIVFVLTSLTGQFVIGWAKPVPVNPFNLRDPKKGMMWVALAGFSANLMLAALSGVLYRMISPMRMSPLASMPIEVLRPISGMIEYCIIINLMLAVFNIIPIPPLDGSKVLAGLLPPHLYQKYLLLEQYGFLVLLILIVTGAVNVVIYPLINFFLRIFQLIGIL
jgi:Zn-dependent protease